MAKYGDIDGQGTITPLPSDFSISGQQQGDILYFDGANWVRLAPGTAGQQLETNGAAANPSWETEVQPNLTGDVTSVGVATTIANNAVTVGKLATGTDGELITWDASGNPTTVATGTATHVLTSNGAGAAPTFQAPAAGGAFSLIDSFEGTNTSNTGELGTCQPGQHYLITFGGESHATGDSELHLLISGETSGYETAFGRMQFATPSMTYVTPVPSGTTRCQIIGQFDWDDSGGAGSPMSGYLWINASNQDNLLTITGRVGYNGQAVGTAVNDIYCRKSKSGTYTVSLRHSASGGGTAKAINMYLYELTKT